MGGFRVNSIPGVGTAAHAVIGEAMGVATAKLAGRVEAGDLERVAPGDRIVGAAYELMADNGLEGLTVRAVLERTGVNRRTFYERFPDKDALVLAVFEQSLAAVAEACRREIGGIADPLERLRFIVDYLVLSGPTGDGDPARAQRRGAALCREHMRLAEARPGELQRALRPLILLMAEQLAAGVATGQVRDDPPEALAAFVYNLVSTTVHAVTLASEAGAGGGAEHARRLAEALWAFCRRGVAP